MSFCRWRRALEKSALQEREREPKRKRFTYFADAGYPRENVFTAIDVLDGRLSEKEVNVLAYIERADELRLIQPLRIVLDGSTIRIELFSVGEVVQVGAKDDRIGTRKLGHRAGVECRQVGWISVLHPDGGRVILRVEGALGNSVADARIPFVRVQFAQVRLQRRR